MALIVFAVSIFHYYQKQPILRALANIVTSANIGKVSRSIPGVSPKCPRSIGTADFPLVTSILVIVVSKNNTIHHDHISTINRLT